MRPAPPCPDNAALRQVCSETRALGKRTARPSPLQEPPTRPKVPRRPRRAARTQLSLGPGPRARRGARWPRALQAAWATEQRPQGRAHLPLRGATSGRFRAAPTVLRAADSGPRGGDPQPPNCGLPLPRDSVVAEAGPSLKGTRNGSKRDWKMSFYKKRCILETSFPLTYVKTNCVNIKKPYCPKGQSPGSGREQQRSGLRGRAPGHPDLRPDRSVAPHRVSGPGAATRPVAGRRRPTRRPSATPVPPGLSSGHGRRAESPGAW